MNRKIIAGGAALVVIAAAAVGLKYRPWNRAARSGPAHARPAKPASLAYVDVKELTLRLADSSVEHYIKLSPVLAVTPSQQAKIEEEVPLVRDRIVTIVTSQTSTALATPEGELRLKKDLIKVLKSDFGDDLVDIYFSGYLVE